MIFEEVERGRAASRRESPDLRIDTAFGRFDLGFDLPEGELNIGSVGRDILTRRTAVQLDDLDFETLTTFASGRGQPGPGLANSGVVFAIVRDPLLICVQLDQIPSASQSGAGDLIVSYRLFRTRTGPDALIALSDSAGTNAETTPPSILGPEHFDPSPIFGVDPSGRIDLVSWNAPDEGDTLDTPILEELFEAAERLVGLLAGTNAHQDILAAAVKYRDGVGAEQPSVSRLYARGVVLNNVAYGAQSEIRDGVRSPIPSEAMTQLNMVEDLHAALMAASATGRRISGAAALHRRGPNDQRALSEALHSIATAIGQSPDLFSASARGFAKEMADQAGRGPDPAASNQVAEQTIGGLLAQLGRCLKGPMGVVGLTFAAEVLMTSAPGAAFVKGGASTVSAAWTFLSVYSAELCLFAGLAAQDAAWLVRLSALSLQRSRTGH